MKASVSVWLVCVATDRARFLTGLEIAEDARSPQERARPLLRELTSRLNAVKYSNQVKERPWASRNDDNASAHEIRERILDAALEVFATEGVEGVTMRALADAIEYSPPVIYAHFRDKDAIIEELCYRQLRSLAKAFANFGDARSRRAAPAHRVRLRRFRGRASRATSDSCFSCAHSYRDGRRASSRRTIRSRTRTPF